ncbi:MAG: PIN domain-containing protein [Polyangiaceae bacterium]
MTRVFLDANVLFSAAWRADSGLTRLSEIAWIHLVTSPYAADQAERNLTRKPSDGVERLKAPLDRLEIKAAIVSLDEGHGLPAKDVPILAAAVGAQCEVLLTGDIADFGHAINRSLQGVRIPTASLLLAELDCPLTSKWRIQALARIAGGVRRSWPASSPAVTGAHAREDGDERSASSIGSSPPRSTMPSA